MAEFDYMSVLNEVSVTEEYNDYLTKHIANVKNGYDWLVTNLPDVIPAELGATIQAIIARHDRSKYSAEEYNAYAEYFYGKSKTKEVKNAFNMAWLHHIHNNPHHWQHWVLINDDDGNVRLDMPYEYIIEMFCDHWAFSWAKGNLYEVFDWYAKHKKTIMFSDNTKKTYEELLKKVKDKLVKDALND